MDEDDVELAGLIESGRAALARLISRHEALLRTHIDDLLKPENAGPQERERIFEATCKCLRDGTWKRRDRKAWSESAKDVAGRVVGYHFGKGLVGRLARRVEAGHAALEELIRLHEVQLKKYLANKLGHSKRSTQDIDDIFQELCVRLIRSKFKKKADKPWLAFAKTIAKNVISDHSAKRARGCVVFLPLLKFEELQTQGLPQAMLNALERMIDQTFSSPKGFWDGLKKRCGTAGVGLTKQWREMIAKQLTVLPTTTLTDKHDVVKLPLDQLGSDESFQRLTAPLTENEREVIYLVHVKGLTKEEIARSKVLPLGTINSRYYRALHTLRGDGDVGNSREM